MKTIIITFAFVVVFLLGVLQGMLMQPFAPVDCISHSGWMSTDGDCFIEDKQSGYTYQLYKIRH